jgi:hypothetical protein
MLGCGLGAGAEQHGWTATASAICTRPCYGHTYTQKATASNNPAAACLREAAAAAKTAGQPIPETSNDVCSSQLLGSHQIGKGQRAQHGASADCAILQATQQVGTLTWFVQEGYASPLSSPENVDPM